MAYEAFCAQAGVLGDKVAFTTGVVSQPASSGFSANAVTLTTTFASTDSARCVVLPATAAPPSASDVLAANDALGSPPAATPPSGGGDFVVTYSGLNDGVKCHAYCAQSNSRLAGPASFTTGIVSQPTVISVMATSVILSITFASSGSSRCVALADDADAPTAAQVLGGQNAVGVDALGARPAATAAAAGQAFLVQYGALVAGTKYDAYCAQAGVLSDKASFTAGVAAQTTADGTVATVAIAVTFAASADARCVVLTSGASAPSAAEIFTATGAVGVAPVARTASASTAYTVTYSGLAIGAAFDAYCAQGSVLRDDGQYRTLLVVHVEIKV